MNISALFPEARSVAAKRLMQLGTRREELRAEARNLRGQAAADDEQATTLAAELRAAEAHQRAFAEGEGEVKRISAKLAKIKKTDAERQKELGVISDAIAAVEREAERHAREHAPQLWSELGKDNTIVAERLRTTIAATAEALDDYRRAATRATEMLRLVDVEKLRVTRVPEAPDEITALVKAAKIAAPSIRVPVPELPGQGPVVRLAETVESAALTPPSTVRAADSPARTVGDS